jgi:hypothetical protein
VNGLHVDWSLVVAIALGILVGQGLVALASVVFSSRRREP